MKLGNILGLAFFGTAALGGVTSLLEGIAEKQAKEQEQIAQQKKAQEAAIQQQHQAARQAIAEQLKQPLGGSSAKAQPATAEDKKAALKTLRKSLKSSRYRNLVVNVRNNSQNGTARVIVSPNAWDDQTQFEKRTAAQYVHASWRNAGGAYATQTEIATTTGKVLASVTRSSSSPIDEISIND